jgi:phage-related protein
MYSNLFEINAWNSGTNYLDNDIVYSLSGNVPLYFYAKNPNLNANPTGAGTGDWTNQFNWIPSYSSNNDVQIRKLEARFGDGYSQRQRDGINSVMSSLNLTFENRPDSEAKAIMHFVESKGGVESFYFTGISLYKTGNKYIGEELKFTHVSYNNNNVSFVLKQVPEL